MRPALLVAALLSTHFAAPAQAGLPRAVEPNCNAVHASAVRDLRAFCEAEPYNQRRLVDYGYQLDLLEKSCDRTAEAQEIAAALNAKVHKHDERACLDIADRLSGAAK